MKGILLSVILFIIVVKSGPINRKQKFDQICQNGRVCTNSCYSNEQLTNCDEDKLSKFVEFNPTFEQRLPSIHLQLIRFDSSVEEFFDDVEISKENVTSNGMYLHFNLLNKSNFSQIFCIDWQACSINSNDNLY